MTDPQKPSRNERRDAARTKAREQRVRQQRRARRNRLVLQLSIGLVIVAVVAVVAAVIVHSARPHGPAPENMVNGGISLQGPSLAAIRTGATAADATSTLSPTVAGGRVLIQAYEDFGCPNCREFEQQYGPYIKQLVTSGAAVIQYHPVAILDRSFTDHDYSTRAANAAAAVANYSPDAFSKFHTILFQRSVQPAEGSAGLRDAQLLTLIKRAGATNLRKIAIAVRDRTFTSWVRQRTNEFAADTGPPDGVDFTTRRDANGKSTGPGTPELIVNGQYWNGTTDFGAFVTKVGGVK